ncbi:hypothetical protein EJB05_47844, partial [Eragrostis curvula]
MNVLVFLSILCTATRIHTLQQQILHQFLHFVRVESSILCNLPQKPTHARGKSAGGGAQPRLPALELEVLDGEEEEEGEEGDDGEVEAGDELEVAVLQAQVGLQELAHRLLPEPRHPDQLRPVAQLREHQPVHRPRRRVRPVHPTPPHRDHLHKFQIRRQGLIVTSLAMMKPEKTFQKMKMRKDRPMAISMLGVRATVIIPSSV